jgi:acyl-CoA thioester hydrolase
MSKQFKISFQARWADMDFNGHMKNTAFLDYAADSRMLFFKENGFQSSNFAKLQIGPVIFSDKINYFKELFMYDNFSIKLLLSGINKNGSKFSFFNEIIGMDNKMIASVESKACWLDLKTRKITAPPEELFNIIKALEKTEDFKISD